MAVEECCEVGSLTCTHVKCGYWKSRKCLAFLYSANTASNYAMITVAYRVAFQEELQQGAMQIMMSVHVCAAA